MATCPSCSAEVDAEAEICLSCGEPLGPSATHAKDPAVGSGAPRVKAATPPVRPTIAATPSAKRRREPEVEAVRCPGCGTPSTAARCPGCGGILKRDA